MTFSELREDGPAGPDVFEITVSGDGTDELDLQELLGITRLPPLVTAPGQGPRAVDAYEEIDLGSLI